MIPRPADREQCARELYGLSPDWHAHTWAAKGDRDNGYTELTGGIVRDRDLTGEWDWGGSRQENTYAVPEAMYRKWLRSWEIETGKCSTCQGTGQEVVGVSAADGVRHSLCLKCGGTGKIAL